MTQTEIQSVLLDFIGQQFPAATGKQLDHQTSLIHNGIIDSLGVLEIVTFVEQRFQVAMTDDEMVSEHFDSVQALANLIADKLPRDASCKV